MTSCERTRSMAAGTVPDSYHTLTGVASVCQCALHSYARPGTQFRVSSHFSFTQNSALRKAVEMLLRITNNK